MCASALPLLWMVHSTDQSTLSARCGWFTYPEVSVAHEEARGGGVARCGHDQSLRGDAHQLALVEVVHNRAEVALRESDVRSQARVLLLVAGIALVRLRCVVLCHWLLTAIIIIVVWSSATVVFASRTFRNAPAPFRT